jgi:hypothetical protein
MVNFRKYAKLDLRSKQIVDGVTPAASLLTDQKEFVVIAPDKHVLTEKEWSILIEDNIAVNGKLPKRKSRFTMDKVRIYHSPYPEDIEEIIKERK